MDQTILDIQAAISHHQQLKSAPLIRKTAVFVVFERFMMAVGLLWFVILGSGYVYILYQSPHWILSVLFGILLCPVVLIGLILGGAFLIHLITREEQRLKGVKRTRQFQAKSELYQLIRYETDAVEKILTEGQDQELREQVINAIRNAKCVDGYVQALMAVAQQPRLAESAVRSTALKLATPHLGSNALSTLIQLIADNSVQRPAVEAIVLLLDKAVLSDVDQVRAKQVLYQVLSQNSPASQRIYRSRFSPRNKPVELVAAEALVKNADPPEYQTMLDDPHQELRAAAGIALNQAIAMDGGYEPLPLKGSYWRRGRYSIPNRALGEQAVKAIRQLEEDTIRPSNTLTVDEILQHLGFWRSKAFNAACWEADDLMDEGIELAVLEPVFLLSHQFFYRLFHPAVVPMLLYDIKNRDLGKTVQTSAKETLLALGALATPAVLDVSRAAFAARHVYPDERLLFDICMDVLEKLLSDEQFVDLIRQPAFRRLGLCRVLKQEADLKQKLTDADFVRALTECLDDERVYDQPEVPAFRASTRPSSGDSLQPDEQIAAETINQVASRILAQGMSGEPG